MNIHLQVKLAEDMVTRGSFTTLNNQLLPTQCQMNTPPPLNTTNLRRMAQVSPTITVHGNDGSYNDATVCVQNSDLGNLDMNFNDMNNVNGVMSDGMSCGSIWPPFQTLQYPPSRLISSMFYVLSCQISRVCYCVFALFLLMMPV